MSITALLSGILLLSAPEEPKMNEYYVLMRAKIVKIDNIYFKRPRHGVSVENPSIPLFLQARTTIEIQQIVLGSFEPKQATFLLSMTALPNMPGDGQYIYLFARKKYDGSLDPVRWNQQKAKICLTDEDADIYEIPKQDLVRLVAAGDINCPE